MDGRKKQRQYCRIMKNNSSIETYLSQSLQFGKTTQNTEKMSLLGKDRFQKSEKNNTDPNSNPNVVPGQNSIPEQNTTLRRNHDYYWDQEWREKDGKNNCSQVLLSLIYTALQAQLLAERNREHSRLVSASSQGCQGITDFQEGKDIITQPIPRNATAIRSDLSTFPRWRVWPDSEENWAHSSCSMNPCSETKAGHAAAEKNQKEIIQKETPHLLEKLGKPGSKVFCRALRPCLLCVQPTRAIFH